MFGVIIRYDTMKSILLSSSRAFSFSTPTFLLFAPVDNSEARWKKATKCNKILTYKASLKQLNWKTKCGCHVIK